MLLRQAYTLRVLLHEHQGFGGATAGVTCMAVPSGDGHYFNCRPSVVLMLSCFFNVSCCLAAVA